MTGRAATKLAACALAALAAALGGGPSRATVILENTTARVVRNDYATRARSPRHTHTGGRFVLVLAGGTLRVITSTPKNPSKPHVPGKPIEMVEAARDVSLATGSAMFRCGETHALENVGPEEISLLEIEMKEADGSACAPADTENQAEPGERAGSGAVLFRNRFGTVVLHRIAPRERLEPARPGTERAVYWIRGGELRSRSADGTDRTRPWHTGKFSWLAAGEDVSGVNAGSEPIELVEILIEHVLPRRRMNIRGL